MRKVILYSAQSMDGFIARKDGDINWLSDPSLVIEGEDFGYKALLESVDTTLMGKNTFKQVIGFDMPFPYAGMKNYVFSRDPALEHEEVSVIRENLAGFVSDLKQQKGKDIWLIGGGQLNGILHQKGLIDEYFLTVLPVFLGNGIRLLEGIEGDHWLNLKASKSFSNGMVQLVYIPK